MLAAPPISAWLERNAATGVTEKSWKETRSPSATASHPSFCPRMSPSFAEAGVKVLINNRPDAEVPPQVQSDVLRGAAEAAGMVFIDNPVSHAAPHPRHRRDPARRDRGGGRAGACLLRLGQPLDDRLGPRRGGHAPHRHDHRPGGRGWLFPSKGSGHNSTRSRETARAETRAAGRSRPVP